MKNLELVGVILLILIMDIIFIIEVSNYKKYSIFNEKFGVDCPPGYKLSNPLTSYKSVLKGWCIKEDAKEDVVGDSEVEEAEDYNRCPNSKRLSAIDSYDTETNGWCDLPPNSEDLY